MKVKTLPVLVTAIALFVIADSSTHAQQSNEWTQFRGPNGAGVAEGSMLPAEFSATKNLVWKAPVPFARSSPVVTSNRVFLTATDADKLITVALDRATGKVLWRRDVVRPRHMT